MENGTRLAAVDLGSNSFRLEIGVFDHGQIRRSDYLKETVRQGNGLDEQRNLTPEAMQRGIDCLARFGERLSGFAKHQVRAVATQTMREARNREEFLARAHQALGFPVDVISGQEEARLIYQGVSRLLPQSDERRLVVDIGGRSTELILGQAYQAEVLESYRVGSVAWSLKYFAQGQFSANAFYMAEIAAKAVLDEALNLYRPECWDIAYGSSGTVAAVSEVLHAAGWPERQINREGLNWLMERLIKAQSAERLRLDGLREERVAIIGGGISVLRALFDLFDISTLHTAEGALRHGLLHDLIDREHDQTDLRATTVTQLALKFQIDAAQAQRVSSTAVRLLNQLGSDSTQTSRQARKLEWAAQLHELGCHISHSEYHKHGAYLLDNIDAPGFAVPELHRLGLLVLGQRGKLKKLNIDWEESGFVQQLLCLRLAVILCHARRNPDLEGLTLRRQGQRFCFTSRIGWANAFPQSAHLLRLESQAWQKMPWSLELELA